MNQGPQERHQRWTPSSARLVVICVVGLATVTGLCARWALLNRPESVEFISRTRMVMGTFATVTVPRVHEELVEPAFTVMTRIERSLSTYQSESEVSRLNRQGFLEHPSADLRDVLRRSLEIGFATRGYFDVSVGVLVADLYGFDRLHSASPEELAPPSLTQAKLKDALTRVNANWVENLPGRIRLKRPGMKLDFGGIGKGFAVDQAVMRLREGGVRVGRVAISGDLRCLDRCLVTIADPFSDAGDEAWLARFRTKRANIAISTSGNSQRYLREVKNNHLLNPKTGLSQQNFASVTLLGHLDNASLDALATAVAVMPVTEAKAFLAARTDLAFILVTTHGEQIFSPRLDRFVENFSIHPAVVPSGRNADHE